MHGGHVHHGVHVAVVHGEQLQASAATFDARQVFEHTAALRVDHRLISQRDGALLVVAFTNGFLVCAQPGRHIDHALHFHHHEVRTQANLTHSSRLVLHHVAEFVQLAELCACTVGHEARLFVDHLHCVARTADGFRDASANVLKAHTNDRLVEAGDLLQRRHDVEAQASSTDALAQVVQRDLAFVLYSTLTGRDVINPGLQLLLEFWAVLRTNRLVD